MKDITRCPGCGNSSLYTTDVRPHSPTGGRKRYKQCSLCNTRFATIEIDFNDFKQLYNEPTKKGWKNDIEYLQKVIDLASKKIEKLEQY